MSRYLVERIEGLANVDVVIGCEIAELEGSDGNLGGITIRERKTGKNIRKQVSYLFSFIGAEPNTDWLRSSGIALDERGFVLTGDEAGEARLTHETSRRGVFAVGDVKSGSVKRVASSVGDGAQVVAAIHSYLAKDRLPADQIIQQVVATV